MEVAVIDQSVSGELIVAPLSWAKRRGRYSAYRPEYCEQMVEYFESGAQTILAVIGQSTDQEAGVDEVTGTQIVVKARKREEVRRLCGQIPTFQRFAGTLGVIAETLINWNKQYPDFAAAYKHCQDIHWDWFTQGLASGAIPANAGIFLAKNMTNMTDDTTVNVRAVAIADTPPVELRERTPGELARLKEAVALAEALGYRITISDAETAPAPHATATLL